MTVEKIIEAIQTIRNEIESELKFNERGKILVKVLENNLKATIQGLTEFDKIYSKNYLIFYWS